MEPAQSIDVEVYASYRQFYLVDPEAETTTDLVWDGRGLERHLGVSDGIVAVGTIGHCPLPVRLELWPQEPPADEREWDHVVEASLQVESGLVALAGVEGPEEMEPLAVEPGSYRVRSSAAGLDDASEMDGGDRYCLQVWPAPLAEPVVRRWWPPWNPAGAEARPTTSGGRLVIGAESHDARLRMSWLGSRGVAHLFRDADGVLWEHSALPDAAGTPQLEELDEQEAERRYGPKERWGPPDVSRPSVGRMARAVWQTWRYSRGWRPDDRRAETLTDAGLRVVHGVEAISRLHAMTALAFEQGDTLYRDADGTLWELSGDSIRRSAPTLTELTPEAARGKFGADL